MFRVRRKNPAKFNQLLKERHERKHDMVVPSDHLEMTEEGLYRVVDAPLPESLEETLRELGVDVTGDEFGHANLPYKVTKTAHSHVCQRLPLPAFKRSYDYMRQDEPEMLADVVNHYLRDIQRNLFIRTYRPENEDGTERGILRAVLSDSYGLIDNWAVFQRAAKTLRELEMPARIQCNLSQRNMWVQFSLPEMGMRADDFVADYENPHPEKAPYRDVDPSNYPHSWVYPGFLLRNSEVGAGAFEIRPRLVTMVCSNGTVRRDDALRKIHIGSQMDHGAVPFTEEIRRKTMKLTDEQVREAVKHFTSEEYMMDVINDVLGKDANKMLENPKEAVVNTADELEMTEEEESELFNYFMDGKSRKRSAIPQSVSAMAQTIPDPDRAYELESKAWDVLDHMDRLDRPVEETAS